MNPSFEQFDIEIINETRTRSLNLKEIEKATAAMLHSMGWRAAALSILLVTDKGIRVYNKTYLGHDRPTDVIAFSQVEEEGPDPLLSSKPYLGDMVISLQTARKQAKEYHNSLFYEVCFYICHGILHMVGFLDDTVRERKRMHGMQAEILKKSGVERK